MFFNIVLLGSGQLGSRYLQGLAKSGLKLRIKVVDTSETSLSLSHQRWLEAGGNQSEHQIELLTTIDSLNSPVDVVVVSTPAGGRAALISSLARKISASYWVIEKVLAQSSEELEEICEATSDAKGCWVNTPRRLMVWHKELKTVFSDQGSIRVSKAGGLWGLACNAIHFIDLVSWWSGESLVAIDSTGLDPKWFESKRRGYYETPGTLVACYSGGTELRLTSQRANDKDFLKVNMVNGDSWLIDETKGLAESSTGININGRIEYQSELTAPMVDEILTSGACGLPTLEESAAQHAIFLDGMLAHWNRSRNSNQQKVPIT